jgi:hypothetical protein
MLIQNTCSPLQVGALLFIISPGYWSPTPAQSNQQFKYCILVAGSRSLGPSKSSQKALFHLGPPSVLWGPYMCFNRTNLQARFKIEIDVFCIQGGHLMLVARLKRLVMVGVCEERHEIFMSDPMSCMQNEAATR